VNAPPATGGERHDPNAPRSHVAQLRRRCNFSRAGRLLGPLAIGAAGWGFVYASTEAKFIVLDLSFALLGAGAFVGWMRRARS
jgi:hypothetical protein